MAIRLSIVDSCLTFLDVQTRPQFQPSNVLFVEVPPQFIALCEASGASPQAALRGMAAMLCGLRYDADNRLVPLDGPTA